MNEMDVRYLGMLAADLMEPSPERMRELRTPARPSRNTRRARLRQSVAFGLVELGLRLAMPVDRATGLAARERR